MRNEPHEQMAPTTVTMFGETAWPGKAIEHVEVSA